MQRLELKELELKSPRIVVKPPGPKAREIIERCNKSVSALAVGIGKVLQIVFSDAKGALVKDVDGNIFIDFTSAVTTNNTGHSHPKVVEAIVQQAEKFIHAYEYPYELKAEVAELLCQITPGNFEKAVIFSNCGTESVENALRIAEMYTKRREIISLWQSFHGKTRGSASITTYGSKLRKGIKKLPEIHHIPYPDCNHCPLHETYPECGIKCLEFFDHVINFETDGEIAAVIFEPILGGGCVVPPPEYWPALAKKCREVGALVIDDEVQASFGRTGKMFAIQHYEGVEPDIITCGKGLASGLPVGSTILRKDISDELAKDYGGLFTSTFGANAVILAAAKASIETYLEEKLPEKAAKLGEHTIKRCKEMSERHEIIGHIQGKGLLIGLELVKDKEKDIPARDYALEVCKRAFENGLLIFNTGWQGNFVKINPPLVITKEQLDSGLDILEKVISEIERERK
jgi:4-aminobutyrate aminotransferase-like enzyme